MASRTNNILSDTVVAIPKGISVPSDVTHLQLSGTGTGSQSGVNVSFNVPSKFPSWAKFGANATEVILSPGTYVLNSKLESSVSGSGTTNSGAYMDIRITRDDTETLGAQRTNLVGFSAGYGILITAPGSVPVLPNTTAKITTTSNFGGGGLLLNNNSFGVVLRIVKTA